MILVFYLELKDAGEMERAERGASQEKDVEEPSAEGGFARVCNVQYFSPVVSLLELARYPSWMTLQQDTHRDP
jgi:uncharacterized membrane protein